jgi:hypothetical protein
LAWWRGGFERQANREEEREEREAEREREGGRRCTCRVVGRRVRSVGFDIQR